MGITRQDYLRLSLMGLPLEDRTSVDSRIIDWATRYEPLKCPILPNSDGRYLNHFCIGSDPEFCFKNTENRRIEAYESGLKVGLAVGADQNERLVEIRPWPSRSVVKHVAGILTALRWMYRVYNGPAHRYAWRAGAFFAGDGMGGHIHFGRKRPTRDSEIRALDGLARVFKTSGLFPVEEWNHRMHGDNFHNAPYGLPGDFRIQRHGFEYRSLPSWLQSPTVAFIVLVSAKLAVLDPEITTTWRADVGQAEARKLLRGLAKLYRGRDDDAYLLYHVLTKNGDSPFDVDYRTDFSTAWGIPRTTALAANDSAIILPTCIEPNPEEVQEIQNYLLRGTPLEFHIYPPTFVSKLPEGVDYKWVPESVNPGRHSGFGDLIHNLVFSPSLKFYWNYSNTDDFAIVGAIPVFWSAFERELINNYYPRVHIQGNTGTHDTEITVPRALCQTQTIAGFRAILLNTGLFPLWTVPTVKADSLKKWLANHNDRQKFNKSWRNYSC
jgi:hypothetical protein